MSTFLLLLSTLALGQDIGIWGDARVMIDGHDSPGVDYDATAVAIDTMGIDIDFVHVEVDGGVPDVTDLDELATALTAAGSPARLVAIWDTYTNTGQTPTDWESDLSTLLAAIDALGHSQIDGFAIHELHKDTRDFNHTTNRWSTGDIQRITDTIGFHGYEHLAYIPADYRALMFLDEPILLGFSEIARVAGDEVWVEAELPIPSGVQADSAELSFSYATERNADVELSVVVDQGGVQTTVWTTGHMNPSTPNLRNVSIPLSPLVDSSSATNSTVRLVVHSPIASNSTVPVFVSDAQVALVYPEPEEEPFELIGEWHESMFYVSAPEEEVVPPYDGGGIIDEVEGAEDDWDIVAPPEEATEVGPMYDDGIARVTVDDFMTFGRAMADPADYYALHTNLALNAQIDGLLSVLPGSDAVDDGTYAADRTVPAEAFVWIDEHIPAQMPRYAAIRALDGNAWSTSGWYTWEEGTFAEVLDALRDADVTAPVVYRPPLALAAPTSGAFTQRTKVGTSMFEAYFVYKTNLPGHNQVLYSTSTPQVITRLFIWDGKRGSSADETYLMEVWADDGTGAVNLWSETEAVDEGDMIDGACSDGVYPNDEVSTLHRYNSVCMREVDLSHYTDSRIPAGSSVYFMATQVQSRSATSGDKLAFLPACEDGLGHGPCDLSLGDPNSAWSFSSEIFVPDLGALYDQWPVDIYEAVLTY